MARRHVDQLAAREEPARTEVITPQWWKSLGGWLTASYCESVRDKLQNKAVHAAFGQIGHDFVEDLSVVVS